MTRLKVLFADDQIPDEGIPDAEVASAMMKKYPGEPPGSEFLAAFLPMRQAVKTLRDGYDVTVANTKRKALDSIKATHFDIAIIDLRWDGDKEVARAESDSTGWAICDAIEKADKDAALPATFQVICSSRFGKEPQIAMIAAQKSKLPVFKSYNEAGSLSLLAAVNFIEKYISNPSARDLALERARAAAQTVQRSLDEALIQERRWTTITIGLVTASIVLILAGALAAILGHAQAGTLTSISSIITSIISALLFGQLKSAQKNTRESREAAERDYREAMGQFLSQTPAAPKS